MSAQTQQSISEPPIDDGSTVETDRFLVVLDNFTFDGWGTLREIGAMLALGTPICLAYLLFFLPLLVFMSYAGRLGTNELSATGLGLSYLFVVTLSVAGGIGVAIQGYFAQAYGEKSSEKLRAHLHRSLLIAVAVFLLVSFPLQLNAEAILVLFGQDSTVAHITGIALIIFLPAAFAYYLFEVLSRYLYAQERFMPVIAGAVGIIIIAVVEFVLMLFVLPVNIYGATAMASVGFIFLPIIVYVVMTFYEDERKRELWKCSRDALRKWTKNFKIIVPAIIQLEALWVLTEIETMFAGLLGKTESATQSILLRYSTFIYLVLGGYSAICITRIGEKIGQKSAQNTKTAILATLLLHLGLGIITAVGLTALGYPLAEVSTTDANVITLTTRLMPIVSLYYLFYFMEIAVISHLRAIGHLTVPALLTFVVFYLIVIPVAAMFAFLTDWSLYGIYLANAIGEFLYVTAILLYSLSISIDRVIRRETAEDKAAKQKADDIAVPMYSVPTTQTQLPPDYKDITESASSQEANAIRKSDVGLSNSTSAQCSNEPQDMMKTPNVNRSESPTGSQIGCPAGVDGYPEEELVPLHPGRRKSVKALLCEKTPFFVIVVIVVLLALVIRAFSPLYLNT